MALMDVATPTTRTTPLKRDALGRVCTPRAQRKALLDELERSGLPAARFAKAAGINYQTFASWVQRRRHAGGQYEHARLSESSAERLVEVALPAAVSMPHPAMCTATALELLLLGGARLLRHDVRQAEQAAHLLRLLNAEAYLSELFERLPSATTKTVNELTPHAMAAQRRAAVEAAAEEKTVTDRNLITE